MEGQQISFLKRRKEERLRKRVGAELDRIRHTFRATCHSQLDDVFDEVNDVGLTMIDVLLAAATRGGYGIVVSVHAVQPPPEPETDIEVRAKESGIEIVRA